MEFGGDQSLKTALISSLDYWGLNPEPVYAIQIFYH